MNKGTEIIARAKSELDNYIAYMVKLLAQDGKEYYMTDEIWFTIPCGQTLKKIVLTDKGVRYDFGFDNTKCMLTSRGLFVQDLAELADMLGTIWDEKVRKN